MEEHAHRRERRLHCRPRVFRGKPGPEPLGRAGRVVVEAAAALAPEALQVLDRAVAEDAVNGVRPQQAAGRLRGGLVPVVAHSCNTILRC